MMFVMAAMTVSGRISKKNVSFGQKVMWDEVSVTAQSWASRKHRLSKSPK